MQATVNTFDQASGTGSVVLDDGLVLPFSEQAFATSGLRLVRPGQRVSVTSESAGHSVRITSMWLESVGFVPGQGQ